MKEKRSVARYMLHAPVRIDTKENGAIVKYETVSRDISSKGVFLEVKKNIQKTFKVMQPVHLEFTLTYERFHELFGGVKNVALEIDGNVLRFNYDGIVDKFRESYSIIAVG